MLRSMVLDVADDKETVPEITSMINEISTKKNECLKEDQTWSWSGFNPKSNQFKVTPQLNTIRSESTQNIASV